MQPSSARVRTACTLVAACTLFVGLVAPASGQSRLQDIEGYEPPENGTLFNDEWIDPAIDFGLDPATLTPPPDFDFTELHQSTVLAAGVELIGVDNDIVPEFEERHLRVLQVAETLSRDIDQADADIEVTNATVDERQGEANELNVQIQDELAEEERLADEISVRERAIVEFAIRAFTGEGTADLIVTEPNVEFGRARAVTNEVSNDLRLQISERQVDLAQHVAQRVVLEDDLELVHQEIAQLEAEIDALELHKVELTEFVEENELLADETAASYELALHTRLTDFVADTDLPYVALNAYVIAARTLEAEDPQCQIHWSMLAGIGRIESYHGYFGNSTLDIDGHTTEDIRGLPLDGRILSGGESLAEGAEIPEATGRTEELTVTPAPEPTADTSAEAPSDSSENTNDAPAAPAPAPVVKRLALIRDTDDGVLDGDTVYDRAVGPMQFIPSTWRLYDADGNGDGETEPQNIYDAALASARYLCAATGSMATTEGEQTAYFAYNHDLDYSRNVTEAGARYRSQLTIESPEIEENSGRYYLGISEGVNADNEPLEDPEDDSTQDQEFYVSDW